MDYIRYSSYLTRFLLYEKLLCTFYVLQNQVSHMSQFDDDAEKNHKFISEVVYQTFNYSTLFQKIQLLYKKFLWCRISFFEVLHLFYLEEKQC